MRKHRIDQLRAIPLAAVLQRCGARPDRHDRCKWHTALGTISVSGAKFINWNRGIGGGGAIDLAIHLAHLSFQEALEWLAGAFPHCPPPEPIPARPAFQIPPPDPHKLWRVQRYLVHQRGLAAAWLHPLIQSSTLYADARANAVFLLLGTQNTPVGAELRGTTDRPWRGMAPGSQKDLGFFSIASADPHPSQPIILCESAIDAISCWALHPDHRCLSTAGARPHPQWLATLVGQGLQIYCGFDSDPTGDRAAHAMIALYPAIQRLRPPRHDWNDLLTAPS